MLENREVVSLTNNIHCNKGDTLKVTGEPIFMIPVVKEIPTKRGLKFIHFHIPATDIVVKR